MIELNKKTQQKIQDYINGRKAGKSLSNAQEFELKFDAPWLFENESYQLQIEEDLGESVELLPNDEGIEELTPVHKYKVKIL